jgi:hypothetical protein
MRVCSTALTAGGAAMAGAPVAVSTVGGPTIWSGSARGAPIDPALLAGSPVAGSPVAGAQRLDHALKLGPGLGQRGSKVARIVSLQGECGHIQPEERRCHASRHIPGDGGRTRSGVAFVSGHTLHIGMCARALY